MIEIDGEKGDDGVAAGGDGCEVINEDNGGDGEFGNKDDDISIGVAESEGDDGEDCFVDSNEDDDDDNVGDEACELADDGKFEEDDAEVIDDGCAGGFDDDSGTD